MEQQWATEHGYCSSMITLSYNACVNLYDFGFNLTQNLSRTYAQAVAGVAMQMKYDTVSKNFTLQYHTTKVCTSNTTEVCGLNNARFH